MEERVGCGVVEDESGGAMGVGGFESNIGAAGRNCASSVSASMRGVSGRRLIVGEEAGDGIRVGSIEDRIADPELSVVEFVARLLAGTLLERVCVGDLATCAVRVAGIVGDGGVVRLLRDAGGIRGEVARERRLVRNDRGPLLGLAYRSKIVSVCMLQ